MRVARVLLFIGIVGLVAGAASAQTGACIAGPPGAPLACFDDVDAAFCDPLPSPAGDEEAIQPSVLFLGETCADLGFESTGSCDPNILETCALVANEATCDLLVGTYNDGETCDAPPVPTVPRSGQAILLVVLLLGAAAILSRKWIAFGSRA